MNPYKEINIILYYVILLKIYYSYFSSSFYASEILLSFDLSLNLNGLVLSI
jgi:hypothetical protein